MRAAENLGRFTATEARRIAWATLHHDRPASMSEAEARQVVAPVQPPRRR